MKISAVTFSKINISQPFRRITISLILLTLIGGLAGLQAGCGRVGDPLPPIRYKALVPEMLKVSQRGDQLILSWPKPGPIAMEQSKVIRAEILRREEDPNEPKRLPEEKFLEDARIVGSISSRDISTTEASTLNFVDPVPLAAANGDLRYRYAIRYVKLSGAPMPLSNYAFLEPLSRIARPPADLAASVAQDVIKLRWNAPESNLDDSQPALVMGYNIYRRTKDREFANQPINSQPINGTSFEDRQFKFGNEYIYALRSVSMGKEAPIESPLSGEISVAARDSFPPAAPTNVTAAAAGGVVSIFWPANTERDLKGYVIYRSERRDAPRSDWTKITPAPITATTFRDERAQIGKTYIYYIVAIDNAGNESEPAPATEVEVLQ